jgi:molybdopterin biosynthesis enzyme
MTSECSTALNPRAARDISSIVGDLPTSLGCQNAATGIVEDASAIAGLTHSSAMAAECLIGLGGSGVGARDATFLGCQSSASGIVEESSAISGFQVTPTPISR